MNETEELTEAQEELKELISGITMERWGMYERKFKMGMSDILEVQSYTSVIAANEKMWRDNHVNDIDKFMKSNVADLNKYLALTDDDKPTE